MSAARAVRAAGFTLLELLIVVALIAVVSAVAGLALRDPAETRLEREAVRLASLLEAARSESRALGVAVTWLPRPVQTRNETLDFNFVGLPERLAPPRRWLEPGVTVQVAGATAAAPGIVLGPEPLIGPQRIVLRIDDRSVTLVSDGLGPFALDGSADAAESNSAPGPAGLVR
ncbi:Tfp pilus assembly protein FimT/FimU [Aquabacterium sp.]|uniref:pilus assembly FimT family protein n=1 Tax=Aquabacterium sp. TaxID=1872578 RepID=UPI0035AEADC9